MRRSALVQAPLVGDFRSLEYAPALFESQLQSVPPVGSAAKDGDIPCPATRERAGCGAFDRDQNVNGRGPGVLHSFAPPTGRRAAVRDHRGPGFCYLANGEVIYV